MFESLSYLALQQYWWIIISLLGGILVFLMFVQGGQSMLGSVAKTDMEKSIVVNTLGRKWELTFTTLVLFGGACFAAFPLFYATSFGGAYWAWIAILFCFSIQAVAYEYRNKVGNVLGQKGYESFLFINGTLGVILIGVAVGTFYTGSSFTVDEYNLSYWKYASHGLEAALNITNVALGLALYFLTKILGAQYLIKMVDHKEIVERAHKQIKIAVIPFLVTFLGFVALLLINSGYTYDPVSKIVSLEAHKYLNNLLAMPAVLIIFLVGVVAVLLGIFFSMFKSSENGIFFSGVGTVFTVFAVLLLAGLNNTPFYPSISSIQSSLTIENASSSKFTLTVMSYVSLLVPFVLAYIIYVWRLMDGKKMTEEEIKNTPESY